MMTQDPGTEDSTRRDGAGDVPYLVPLRLAPEAGVSRVGAKAFRLGELERAGFPVPPGVVLDSGALERFLEANGLGPDPASDEVVAGRYPSDLLAALAGALEALGPGPLAVRSSGASEDSKEASFAGLHETVLGVTGFPALVEAVRRCWASAFSSRVVAYRAARAREAVRFAVLIQRQVRADAAGVAFTANPVSGERGETVVSAVRGLGERLVSGEASPDEWVIRGSVATCLRAPEDAIDRATALAVADVALRVERHLGSPQDVEWVIEDRRVAVVQARPITALPRAPAHAVAPPGRWLREESHYPRPLSPMARSILLPAANDALRRSFELFGLLPDTLEHQEIGGWVYQRLVPPGGKDRPPPPRWLMPLAIRIVPALRRRVRRAVHAVRSDVPGQVVERWYAEWKPQLCARIDELSGIDLAEGSDADVAEHLRATAALLQWSVGVHMTLHGALCLSLARLVFACRDLLGWNDADALELLNGLSTMSTAPARQLAEIAAMIRARGGLDELLGGVGDDAADRLARADPVVGEALRRYAQEHGMRAIRYEVADPTLAESPALVAALVRDQLHRGYRPGEDDAALAARRSQALARARELLGRRPSAERERFERALPAACRAYPVREENQLFTVGKPLALIRRVALEAGRRLAERGVLAERDDVFFLELSEALAALGDGAPLRALVAARRRAHEEASAQPGPPAYGRDPGPPPPLDALPPEARFANEAMQWTVDRIFALGDTVQPREGETLHGIPASPGEYTGFVRVVHGEEELGKLRVGDVLVCRVTSPAWAVVFPTLGALVTDAGGILSHPAIIAREYRIPAVVATGRATEALRDGQRVRVDGTRGAVTPLH